MFNFGFTFILFLSYYCIGKIYMLHPKFQGTGSEMWCSESLITSLCGAGQGSGQGGCDRILTGHQDGSIFLSTATTAGIHPAPLMHACRQDG